MPPLRILIISDERPGHFNLSEGIAAAIARLQPAETTRHTVRRGKWPGALLAALTRLPGLSPQTMLSTVYGQNVQDFPPGDVIISAGAETLAASICLARARSTPNIYYGSLRQFSPKAFSLVLTSYEKNATRPNHALFLKPSRIDPDASRPPPFPASGQPLTVALLIGGPSGEVSFTPGDWKALETLLSSGASREGIRWMIANSRRTPDPISDQLAAAASSGVNGVDRFLDVRKAGPGTLAPLLAASHAVLCTADSSSMVSECIWSRIPTGVLLPDRHEFTSNEQAYREWLTTSGWCTVVPLSEAATAPLRHILRSVRPVQENLQVSLATLIGTRIPGLKKQNAPP